MTILGIETSCDETAAAIVKDGTHLIANVLASNNEVNIKYRGVVPDKTAREQLKSIIPILHETLTNIQYPVSSIDAIAVTYGPGLIGSLLIGVETAKTLAFAWNKPLIPVNHLVGHIYANWITTGTPDLPYPSSSPDFPAVVLLVSGGHSDLILMEDHHKITHLGSTRDDAAGECFDKCGRLLGLPYPYGPYIEKEAEKFLEEDSQLTVDFPRPLINSKDFDFSFSGLKTAFLNKYNQLHTQNYELLTPHLAFELQEAITDVLIKKAVAAAKKYQVKSLIIAGGVAANKRLREKLKLEIENWKLEINLYIPPIALCTDNAAYIASCAYFHQNVLPWQEVNADPGVTIAS